MSLTRHHRRWLAVRNFVSEKACFYTHPCLFSGVVFPSMNIVNTPLAVLVNVCTFVRSSIEIPWSPLELHFLYFLFHCVYTMAPLGSHQVQQPQQTTHDSFIIFCLQLQETANTFVLEHYWDCFCLLPFMSAGVWCNHNVNKFKQL